MSSFSREEDEEILVGALVKVMRMYDDRSRGFYEKCLERNNPPEDVQKIIIAALDIAYRNEGSA
jgi:hypothetical protein